MPGLGTAAFCLFSFTWTALQPHFRGDWISVAMHVPFLALWILGSVRYGFLAVVVGTCVAQLLVQSVLTTDLDAWYGRSSLIAVLLVSALTIWAFFVCLGTRTLAGVRRSAASA